MDWSGMLRGAAELAKKEAPTIMTVVAVGGVLVTAFLSYGKKSKVDEIIKEHDDYLKKMEMLEHPDPELEADEPIVVRSEEEKKALRRNAKLKMIRDIVLTMLPVALSVVITAGLMIGANHINLKRIAMYAGAYEIATGKLKESTKELATYKEKLKEVVGEKKAAEVVQAVEDEKVAELCGPDGNFKEVWNTGEGEELFIDSWSGVVFASREAAVERAFSKASKQAIGSDGTCLTDLYSYLNIEAPIKFGDLFEIRGDTEPRYDRQYVRTPSGQRAVRIKYDIFLRSDVDGSSNGKCYIDD